MARAPRRGTVSLCSHTSTGHFGKAIEHEGRRRGPHAAAWRFHAAQKRQSQFAVEDEAVFEHLDRRDRAIFALRAALREPAIGAVDMSASLRIRRQIERMVVPFALGAAFVVLAGEARGGADAVRAAVGRNRRMAHHFGDAYRLRNRRQYAGRGALKREAQNRRAACDLLALARFILFAHEQVIFGQAVLDPRRSQRNQAAGAAHLGRRFGKRARAPCREDRGRRQAGEQRGRCRRCATRDRRGPDLRVAPAHQRPQCCTRIRRGRDSRSRRTRAREPPARRTRACRAATRRRRSQAIPLRKSSTSPSRTPRTAPSRSAPVAPARSVQ